MANHLYVNQSKCLIAQEEVEYLGHVISATGVAADSTKIQSMADWPTPTTTTGLRGFLGLTGYYRKFIQNLLKWAVCGLNYQAQFIILNQIQAVLGNPIQLGL